MILNYLRIGKRVIAKIGNYNQRKLELMQMLTQEQEKFQNVLRDEARFLSKF